MLLQPFQLVPRQRRGRQLNKPAQHSGDHATGWVHAHVRPRVLVPGDGSSGAQVAPLLLPCGGGGGHGALLAAALVPDGSGCATVLLGSTRDPQRRWATPVRQRCPVRAEHANLRLWPFHGRNMIVNIFPAWLGSNKVAQKLPVEIRAKASLFPQATTCFLQRKHSFTLQLLPLIPVSTSGLLLFFRFDWYTAKQCRAAAIASVRLQPAFQNLRSSTFSYYHHYKTYFMVFWFYTIILNYQTR